jgi:hypothetical protein
MTLFVDPNGDLYPCRGLLGERAYSLGSILEPVNATLIASPDSYALPLATLMQKGPFATGVPAEVVSIGRASVCQAHREALLRGAH